jgi:hypothetical protein
VELYYSLVLEFGMSCRGYVGADETATLVAVEATLEYHTGDSGPLTVAVIRLRDGIRWVV